MGQAKQKRRALEAEGFTVRPAKICEYELCSPGPLGEQTKEWICAALPEESDLDIARRALGAPITRFTSTWDGARVDVYMIEDWNRISPDERIVNADATLAWQAALAKRGVSRARVLQESPMIGPNVARYTEDCTLVQVRHARAVELEGSWKARDEATDTFTRVTKADTVEFYLKDEDDITLLRELYDGLRDLNEAA
ncbi:hypothetical protein [Methylobacterium sp. UNC300MFChir4.1]|uniref:hypothetical protein n=1 Tax=Methylobacterium sp. UNC300MFChir4.1 TaxID=1502747 RepID=UPI0011137806|nr:hypothetical protein [Methylobacterium sp. UNC300MFChir4.1]